MRRGLFALVVVPLAFVVAPARGDNPPLSLLNCDNSGYEDSFGRCTPLHPGDAVSFPGFYCTLNFLWMDPRGNRYFGTAGHCTLGSPVGTVAGDGLTRPIGRLVYTLWDPTDDSRDFALVKLFPGVKASGEVRHWGGPTAAFTGFDPAPQVMCVFGEADGLSVAAGPRTLVATAITQPAILLVNGALSYGDSGAPVVRSDGTAVGWVESLQDTTHDPVYAAHGGVELGEEVVTRIGPAVKAAEKALHVRLSLVTTRRQSCKDALPSVP